MSVNATAAAAVGSRMTAEVGAGEYQSLLRHPKFQALVSSRNRFGWTLSLLMLFIYLGFIFLVAFDKPLLAQKVDRILADAGYDPEAHDGRALRNILDTWPRDEQLIDTAHKALYSVVTGIVAERLVRPDLQSLRGRRSH